MAKSKEPSWQWDKDGRAIHTIAEPYKPRFIKPEHEAEIVNFYHLTKTALSGQDCSHYARLQLTVKWFLQKYDYASPTAVYKDAEGLTQQP